MKLKFYIPPRLERKVKKAALKTDFSEIWKFMGRYGMNGWYYYLGNMDMEKISKELEDLDRDVDYILSIGTGGSYQGIEMLTQFSEFKEKFLFIGPSLDPEEIRQIIQKIQGKRIGFNIISKSGSTLEILVFINLFKEWMAQAEWISVITSNPYFSSFLEKTFSQVPVIRTFGISDDIGGRFSIVSSMGIVVCYLARLNYVEFARGFLDARQEMELEKDHTALERGITRYSLFSQGKILENLATNVKKVLPTLKWAKQLWAESNGKEYKSMFISVGFYPEDAHSVGQIGKEGPRKVTETYFLLDRDGELQFDNSLSLQNQKIKLNRLSQINRDFIESIIEDRFECGIPVMVYLLKEFSLYEWGKLIFSEMVGTVMEAYLLGVNPFNQPGVESYKKKVQNRIL